MTAVEGVELYLCDWPNAPSRLIAIRLASSAIKLAVRVTGGVRSLTTPEIVRMRDFLAPALSAHDITVIGGGTQMRSRNNRQHTIPGITDVLPMVLWANPQAHVVGVVPRQTQLRLQNSMLVVSDQADDDFFTTIHPRLKTCLLLQYSADRGLPDWDAEWLASLDYMQALRQAGGFHTLHLVYGGGATTERELLHILQLPPDNQGPWHVLLVADSGGVASAYANSAAFVAAHQDMLTICLTSDLAEAMLPFVAAAQTKGEQ